MTSVSTKDAPDTSNFDDVDDGHEWTGRFTHFQPVFLLRQMFSDCGKNNRSFM